MQKGFSFSFCACAQKFISSPENLEKAWEGANTWDKGGFPILIFRVLGVIIEWRITRQKIYYER